MESVAGEVRDLLGGTLPEDPVRTALRLGEGEDNRAYEVNGDLVLRVSKEPDPARRAARVERDAGLLRAVAAVSPLPVPVPVLVLAERGCLAYRKLAGVPLLDLPAPRRSALAPSVGATLGRFVAALHTAPADRFTGLADVDDYPPADWVAEATSSYPRVAGVVPAVFRPRIADFLASPPPGAANRPVFSHNDLGIEHVLVDPRGGAVTGVIDWSDAAFTDPAYDLGLIFRDLGPAALDAALATYPAGDDGLRRRAECYARCTVFEDLAYGVERDRPAYAEKAVAALDWLFPA